MIEVDTTPEVVSAQWPEPPRLLVEWSSRWEEFKTALSPALTRPPKALAGEAPIGMFPYRGMIATWVLESVLLIAVLVLPARFASLEIPLPPAIPQRDVIYYSGDELPQTQDRGGAQAGKSGRAGGQQAHHRTQVIRVARGDRPAEKVVDAPKLNLPHSDSAVANLLVFKPNPGPPPAEGLRPSLTVPADLLSMAAVPPSPDLNSPANRAAKSLDSKIVQPAPEVDHAHARSSPTLNADVVPPTPNVARDKMRTAEPFAPTVIAPAPRDAQRDFASSRIPLTQTVDAVAPPVSAPPRDPMSKPKLTLPAPAVVAPPPSQVSRDLNSWGSSSTGDLRIKPVPPPPSAAVGGGGTSDGRSSYGRPGAGAALAPQVVPPTASIGGTGSGRGTAARSGQSASALLGSTEVVPPPPALGGGKALSGSGRGTKGAGAGGPLDLGSAVAPPVNAGGNTPGTGVVVSSQPGSKVGLPDSTGAGALALSTSGTAKTGLGGSGGGAGLGKGTGPGSGLQGEGSGAGRDNAGAGRGSDPNSRGGISPYPGPGGAGSGSSGAPAMPGVSVEGGTTTIMLPSFGAPGGDAPSTGPGRSSTSVHKGSGITIEATPRSGGVFGYYDVLKGDRNYSIYIETSLGTAVMQYADPASATHPSTEALTAPEPMHKDLPIVRSTRVVITCILDRTGELKDIRVLEPGAAESTSKILAALHNWKFRPAFRGNEPVEVNVILGFGIDTR